MERIVRIVGVVACAASLVLATAAWAEHHEQAEEKPLYRIVHYDKVDPTKIDDFEKRSLEWHDAAVEAELGQDWYWFSAQGSGFTYMTAFAFSSYADLDQDEAREKELATALGEERYETLNAPTGSILSHRSEIIKHLRDLSYYPAGKPEAEPGFLHVSVHHVRPGMETTFKELSETVRAAYVKTEAPLGYGAWQVEYGEGSFLFSTVAASAEEFHSNPMTGAVLAEAYGKEEAGKLFAAWRECVTSYDSEDYRPRPDLSYTKFSGEKREEK